MRVLDRIPLALSALALWSFGHGNVAAAPAADGATAPAADALQRAEEAYGAGRAFLQRGDALRAMEKFRSALRDNPASIDALNGMGVALDRVGRFDLSRPYYETALALDPASAETLHNFGLSMHLQGDRDRAAAMLRQAAGLADGVVRASSLALLARIDRTARPVAPVMQTASAPPTRAAPQPAAAPPAIQASVPPDEVALPHPAVAATVMQTASAPPPAAVAASPLPTVAAPPSGPAADRPPAETVAHAVATPLPAALRTDLSGQPPRVTTRTSETRLVRIGAGEWRLAEARDDVDGPEAHAAVPLWTEADETAAVAREEVRLAASVARAPRAIAAEGPTIAPDAAEHAAEVQGASPPGERSTTLQPRARTPGPLPRNRHLLHPMTHVLPKEPGWRLHDPATVPVDLVAGNSTDEDRFQAPFASDDPRLNAFAERMQRRGVDAIGRLRAWKAHEPLDILPGFIALLPIRPPPRRRHRRTGARGASTARPEPSPSGSSG